MAVPAARVPPSLSWRTAPYPSGGVVKLDPIKDYLLERVHAWRFNSLARRVELIARDHPHIRCTGQCLGRWYRRHRVYHIVPTYHISNTYTTEAMIGLQQEFTIKLLRHWEQGHEIIFIDESTCDPWHRRIKLWVNVAAPFYLDLANERGSGVHVQGAISNLQPEFKWRVTEETNNAETFEKFVKYCIGTWPLDTTKAVYVMDGAGYHHNADILRYLHGKGVSVLFLPASSSTMSPIGKNEQMLLFY